MSSEQNFSENTPQTNILSPEHRLFRRLRSVFLKTLDFFIKISHFYSFVILNP